MRILVTGADGFIGSHLANGLERAGHHVERAIFGRESERASEVRVDLTRPEQFAALPASVDAIVHAAGNVDARSSSAAIFAANLHATQHLLGYAQTRRVSHFVQLSSVAVSGH